MPWTRGRELEVRFRSWRSRRICVSIMSAIDRRNWYTDDNIGVGGYETRHGRALHTIIPTLGFEGGGENTPRWMPFFKRFPSQIINSKPKTSIKQILGSVMNSLTFSREEIASRRKIQQVPT